MLLSGHSLDSATRYRLSVHGPTFRLSEHFTLIEMASSDGADEVLVHPALIEGLEQLRAALGGEPLTITSGYRTRKHNRSIGGATRSRHVFGLAADVTTRNASPVKVARVADRLGFGGVGRYRGFTHVDVNTEPGKLRRWTG